MSRTRMCENPQFRSNTPARNVLVTDSVISLFSAPSRFTHYLCSLHASVWYLLILPELMFVDPFRMTSGPGSGGMINAVPGDIVLYTASNKTPLRNTSVPPPLKDVIDA